ncbi:hypothetical protein QL285_012933 [Trifolium repens]|nr:hypothetical protein QL285_012933 [Trifolium repens]
MDGSSLGNPGVAASAGIFRNHNGASLGCFASNIGIATAFFAEFMGIILAIECAYVGNWKQLWIESDSKLAILAYRNQKIIHWQLQNRWSNCLLKIIDMNVIVSHVYKEGNSFADKLSKLGLNVNDFTWWSSSLSSIRLDLARNRNGLPYYRFC